MQLDHASAAPLVFWAGRGGVIAVGACVASLALTLGVLVTVLAQIMMTKEPSVVRWLEGILPLGM
jgi:hypothetical protein